MKITTSLPVIRLFNRMWLYLNGNTPLTRTNNGGKKVQIVVWENSQQPVNSNQQTDILGRQTHGSQDQKHGHQSGTGDTGCSNTGQGGCQTGWKQSNTTAGHRSAPEGVPPSCRSLVERLYWTALLNTFNLCGAREKSRGWGPLGPSQMKCG